MGIPAPFSSTRQAYLLISHQSAVGKNLSDVAQ